MDRTILHCDLNGFFASVECLYKPELKDVPMAVCGSVENRHGIILAKNELAKSYGIVTAETVWQAKRKCPSLSLVHPHHDRYAKYSKIVSRIYERYTDLIEPFGIDESWLDVTGSLHLFGNGETIADCIRETVKKEAGLTVSVGVSFNKVFSKLGSDYKKPDATTIISRENYKTIIYPLHVSNLLYAGRVATEALEKLGITTIGQLAQSNKQIISEKLGKLGAQLHDYANGLDDSPVRPPDSQRDTKSVGNGMTFKRNLIGIEDITTGVMALSESVAYRLRKYGYRCGTVQVIIRDPQFKTISRQKKLTRPTHLMKEISDAAIGIIKGAWDLGSPIRMLTITGMNLVTDESEQISFFGDKDERLRKKREKLEETLDTIWDKFGKDSISIGTRLNNDLGLGASNEEDD
jgi:DNA polymerase IV